MANRRPLQFDSLASVVRDAENLTHGYERAANWSLGQVCDHLGSAMRFSCDGFPSQWPRFMQRMARRMLFGRIRTGKRFRIRFPSPIGAPRELSDTEGVDYLAKGIEQFESREDEFSPHVVFGGMSKAEWSQFHLWHCEHHFSFLLPTNAAERQDVAASSAAGAP